MTLKYQHTLSPIQVGGRLLKNRFLVTRCVSGAFQGDENYPGEGMISICPSWRETALPW